MRIHFSMCCASILALLAGCGGQGIDAHSDPDAGDITLTDDPTKTVGGPPGSASIFVWSPGDGEKDIQWPVSRGPCAIVGFAGPHNDADPGWNYLVNSAGNYHIVGTQESGTSQTFYSCTRYTNFTDSAGIVKGNVDGIPGVGIGGAFGAPSQLALWNNQSFGFIAGTYGAENGGTFAMAEQRYCNASNVPTLDAWLAIDTSNNAQMSVNRVYFYLPGSGTYAHIANYPMNVQTTLGCPIKTTMIYGFGNFGEGDGTSPVLPAPSEAWCVAASIAASQDPFSMVAIRPNFFSNKYEWAVRGSGAWLQVDCLYYRLH